MNCCDAFGGLYMLIVTSGKHLYDLEDRCLEIFKIPRDCVIDNAYYGQHTLVKCPYCGTELTELNV